MMRESSGRTTTLLSSSDVGPVEIVNADSTSPVVLVCEHAGQEVPAGLRGLGVPRLAIDNHTGWDIGAREVTLRVARALGASAVLQRYSRLVIDCNRPPDALDAIPEISDGITVPGNIGLTAAERAMRVAEVFLPFHDATDALLQRKNVKAAFAIHSFTPILGGLSRPWDIGFLCRKDSVTSEHLSAIIKTMRPDLSIGMNQPYQIDDASDWFVPKHGEARGLAHSLIEIRNDHIGDENGQRIWADCLASAITAFLKRA